MNNDAGATPAGFNGAADAAVSKRGVWHRVVVASNRGVVAAAAAPPAAFGRRLLTSNSATVGGSASYGDVDGDVGGQLELWMWKCVHRLQVLIVEAPRDGTGGSDGGGGGRGGRGGSGRSGFGDSTGSPFDSKTVFMTTSCVSSPVPSIVFGHPYKNAQYFDYYEWIYFGQNLLEKRESFLTFFFDRVGVKDLGVGTLRE